MEEYNTVGLETFIPPAPVVQTALTAAGRDRGSSDVMDEVGFYYLLFFICSSFSLIRHLIYMHLFHLAIVKV